MNRHITIIITVFTLLFGTAFTSKARTIKDFFISEPGYVLQLLSQRTKLDMIDYLNEDRMVDVKNNLDEISHFNKVTDNYMSVQTTTGSTVELLLMPISRRDSIIIAVTTVELPAKDSRIQFFTTNWEKYRDNVLIKTPTMKDFIAIPKGDKTKKETILDMIEFPIISYSINPENNTITARHGLKEYMSKEDYEKISPYLKDSIELKYKAGKFTSEKHPVNWTAILISASTSILTTLISCLI